MHRCLPYDGSFTRSLVAVEGILTALKRALPSLGLELDIRKTTVLGPGWVLASCPLAVAKPLHLQECTEVLELPSIHFTLYATAV